MVFSSQAFLIYAIAHEFLSCSGVIDIAEDKLQLRSSQRWLAHLRRLIYPNLNYRQLPNGSISINNLLSYFKENLWEICGLVRYVIITPS